MGLQRLYNYNSANAFYYKDKLYFIRESKNLLEVASYDEKLNLISTKSYSDKNGNVRRLIIENSTPLVASVPEDYADNNMSVRSVSYLNTGTKTELTSRLPWYSKSGIFSVDINYEYISAVKADNISISFRFDKELVHKILCKFNCNVYLEILEQDNCAILVLTNDKNSKTVIYKVISEEGSPNLKFKSFHYNNGMPNDGFRNEKGRFTNYLRSTFITNDNSPVRYPEHNGSFVLPSDDFECRENLNLYRVISHSNSHYFMIRDQQIYSIDYKCLGKDPESLSDVFKGFDLIPLNNFLLLHKESSLYFIKSIEDFMSDGHHFSEMKRTLQNFVMEDDWGTTYEEYYTCSADDKLYFVYLFHRKIGKNLLILNKEDFDGFKMLFIDNKKAFRSKELLNETIFAFKSNKWIDLRLKMDSNEFPNLIKHWECLIKDHILYKQDSDGEVMRFYVPGLRDHNNLDDACSYSVFTVCSFLSTKDSAGRLSELGIRVY